MTQGNKKKDFMQEGMDLGKGDRKEIKQKN